MRNWNPKRACISPLPIFFYLFTNGFSLDKISWAKVKKLQSFVINISAESRSQVTVISMAELYCQV